MSNNPSQLYLLADHIKLSLLERQRALSLSLPANSQDSSISRSLSSLLDGVESLESEVQTTPDSMLQEQATQLRKQYGDLNGQFRGEDDKKFPESLKQPNSPALAEDFRHASSLRHPSSPQSQSRGSKKKTVHYTDAGYDQANRANDPSRAGLFPSRYRDEPSPSRPGIQDDLSNEQIHAEHQQIMQEQDTHLDRLGDSIGRQRDLSMRIGDELDEHVAMLEDVEGGVDRHQGRLDTARSRLGRFARRAEGIGWSWWIILGLILVLVLLIVVFK